MRRKIFQNSHFGSVWLTTGSVPIWTYFAMSIISKASLAIHLAWFSHASGIPDTAIYLSPTVSTYLRMRFGWKESGHQWNHHWIQHTDHRIRVRWNKSIDRSERIRQKNTVYHESKETRFELKRLRKELVHKWASMKNRGYPLWSFRSFVQRLLLFTSSL